MIGNTPQRAMFEKPLPQPVLPDKDAKPQGAKPPQDNTN
jgi:hypothetical protein